jgi:hypothetical protein
VRKCGCVRAALCAAFALASILPATAAAQVIARQGNTKPDGIRTFASPMVLEVPAHMLRDMRAGVTWQVAQFAGYSCEGASIPGITAELTGDRRKKIKVQFETHMALEEGFDKISSLTLELLADDEVVGVAEKKAFDIEEGKKKIVRLTMPLTPASAEAFRMGTKLTLRATLSVFDEPRD